MKLTKEQAIVIMGYTGIVTVPFNEFHTDAEKRLGRELYTHEFGSHALTEELAKAYKSDFLEMCPL